MADYQALKDWLYKLQVFGIKLGLSSTEALLARLGRPDRAYPTIHVAGTNGKGSTAAMLTSQLLAAGYKVGLYTSPHLVNLRERFLIDNRMPRRERIAQTMAKVQAVCDQDEPPTFFEFTTAVALEYYREEKVDLAVIEVGLGGRLDATNVIFPEVGLICNLSLEHTQYLGQTIRKIAWEKAGIIKPGLAVATSCQRPAALSVIQERAAELDSPLFRLGRDFKTRRGPRGFTYFGLDWRLKDLELGLIGPHQAKNAALALAAAELLARKGFRLTPDTARRGLKEVRWPGRLQAIGQRPLVLLDGGHNPQAMAALAPALAEIPRRRLIVVLGAMADKDLKGIFKAVARILKPGLDRLILTRPVYSRAATPEVLARAARDAGLEPTLAPELMAAVNQAREEAGAEDVVLVTGSLFVVGEVMERLGLTVFEEA